MKSRKKIITTIYDPDGIRHRVHWFQHKSVSEECERRVQEIQEYKQVQRVLSPEHLNWLDRQKSQHIDLLMTWGIIDAGDVAFVKTAAEVIDE